jgi:hypothetical protein
MRNPFLFVLGCQRSGTTLLQHILDSHPDIAVMQEAGWFGTWYEQGMGVTPQGYATADLIPRLMRTSKNVDLGVSVDDLVKMLEGGETILYCDFISSLFDRFGASRRKPLSGTKNPDYLRHLPTLNHLWPDAKFIQIIRDGRDVCLCASDRWKGKPEFQGFPFLLYESPDRIFDAWNDDPVITTALWWEKNVRLGSEFGKALGPERYYEMRYEALVTQPYEECLGLCEFLGVKFDSAMLKHEKNFKPREGPGGKILHARVGLPITSGLRDWRTEMTQPELGRFEAAGGQLLDDLGYRRGIAAPSSEDMNEADRIRTLFESVFSEAAETAGVGGQEVAK